MRNFNLVSKIGFLIFISLSLISCKNENHSQNPSKVAEDAYLSSLSKFKIDNLTPDKAVKTWWAFLAIEALHANYICMTNAESHPQYMDHLGKISSSEIYKFKDQNLKSCTMDSYDEEISEVKIESDTRAVVIANVRVTTQHPPEQQFDKYTSERKNRGEKFKYVLEKVDGGWKIEQVYRFDENAYLINRPAWSKLYEFKPYRNVYYFVVTH